MDLGSILVILYMGYLLGSNIKFFNGLVAGTSFEVISDQMTVTLGMQQLLLITSPFPVETCENWACCSMIH